MALTGGELAQDPQTWPFPSYALLPPDHDDDGVHDDVVHDDVVHDDVVYNDVVYDDHDCDDSIEANDEWWWL